MLRAVHQPNRHSYTGIGKNLVAHLFLVYTQMFVVLICYPAQVIWEPYGTVGNVGVGVWFDVNRKCTEEAHLWRIRAPLICFYAVEFHLPQRVMRQFGLYQETPPPYKDTDVVLHG